MVFRNLMESKREDIDSQVKNNHGKSKRAEGRR